MAIRDVQKETPLLFLHCRMCAIFCSKAINAPLIYPDLCDILGGAKWPRFF